MKTCDAEWCACSGVGPDDDLENECQCTDPTPGDLDPAACERCGAWLDEVDFEMFEEKTNAD